IAIQAAQNFTDTAQGTAITFATTSINATTPATRMTLDASGNLGIGTTTTPAAGVLEVSNAASTLPFSSITGTTYNNGTPGASPGALFRGRRARGTAAAPSAVLSGDTLAGLSASGYAATAFGTFDTASIVMRASENWTDTAQGSEIRFITTPRGVATPAPVMTIDSSGNLGVGTTAPTHAVEVARTGTDSVVESTAYSNATGSSAFYIAQTARGTAAAPTAVQVGDFLGGFGMSGYATGGFTDIFAAIAGIAAEDFTATTIRGTALAFGSTPLGTKDIVLGMALLPNGNLGIGTTLDANGIPTAADKLQVFGDIRVGISGTNGCVKNFAGTQLTGVCASDRRYKKGITPFGPTLDRVAALQPVHFYWRADEFPDQHFGDSQAYGLIAQDVEQVLPELVVTHDDGYKAVDYSKLPLLTIQAVKELKAENEDLKKRVAELERLIKELHPAGNR
ncbi:MAG TPA: tail fiber domain-containing protein, partial [Vicinamibacterales bacterium]